MCEEEEGVDETESWSWSDVELSIDGLTSMSEVGEGDAGESEGVECSLGILEEEGVEEEEEEEEGNDDEDDEEECDFGLFCCVRKMRMGGGDRRFLFAFEVMRGGVVEFVRRGIKRGEKEEGEEDDDDEESECE